MKKLMLMGVMAVLGCGDTTNNPSLSDMGYDAAQVDDTGTPAALDDRLPARHVVDLERAARGQTTILEMDGPLIPWEALRSLWVVWGQFSSPPDTEYWAEFSRRYGFVPRDGQLPWGIERRGNQGTVQCMACHVDQIAGVVVIGGGNSRLKIESLYDDLMTLSVRAAAAGLPVPEIPESWKMVFENRTAAPGATDAFGMGMTLGSLGSDIETHYGFQQSAPWWQMRYKDRTYSDGSGSSLNHRTMLATSLASGASLASLQAMDEDLEDIKHYLLSLTAPAWPFEAPNADLVTTGRDVFAANCASCHGVYDSRNGAFPDTITDVNTDPIRHTRFGEREAAWVNASWFGDPPMIATTGYLAPPLVGVWASAPYFHNGSVPNLRALLRPSERPLMWRHTGEYDSQRLGVSYEISGADLYDTMLPGLSNEGHLFGGDLSESDVDALLAYLILL